MSLEMKQIIEGLLFVAESPMTISQLARALGQEETTPIKEAVDELVLEYEQMDRAFTLLEVAGGYAFRTKPELASWLRRSKRAPEARLSPAALETLAIVAYKQPVLKAEVERLRGVAVDGVLRMLMEKDLVKVAGRKDLPGRPLIYGTTKRFLELFGLKNLKDLPTLEEMEALMGDLEPVVAQKVEGVLELPLQDQNVRKESEMENKDQGEDLPDTQETDTPKPGPFEPQV
jgi:segregation and condensation protein B